MAQFQPVTKWLTSNPSLTVATAYNLVRMANLVSCERSRALQQDVIAWGVAVRP